MMSVQRSYKRILVAIDFSPHAEAAARQAVWLARQGGATITLAHTLPDLRRAVHSVSYQAKLDIFYGEGSVFQREVRQESDAKMRKMIADLNAADLDGHQLLDRLMAEHQHLAVVNDALGHVVGVATLEDVLENLLGKPIVGEHDSHPEMQRMARERAHVRDLAEDT